MSRPPAHSGKGCPRRRGPRAPALCELERGSYGARSSSQGPCRGCADKQLWTDPGGFCSPSCCATSACKMRHGHPPSPGWHHLLSCGFGKNSELNPGKSPRMKSSWRPTKDSCVLLILAATAPLRHLALAPRITPADAAHQLPGRTTTQVPGWWGEVGWRESGRNPSACGARLPFCPPGSSVFLPVRQGRGKPIRVKAASGCLLGHCRWVLFKGCFYPP